MNHFIFRIKFFFVLLLAAASLPSCLVSSRSNLDVFNKSEYAHSVSVKTIKVPLLISKPIIKGYLRMEEDVPKEVVDLIGGLKKIRITVAQTANPKLINDFRMAAKRFAGEEWLCVQQGDQWIYLKADQTTGNVIKRISIAISSPEEQQLVYVDMKCKLTPDQLSKLINAAMDSDKGKKMLKDQTEIGLR
jgi:hypothetical protein